MAEQRKVRVRSSENQVVEVEKAVAFQSGIIKDVVDFAGIEAIIPLDGVEGSILAEVFQYCKYHVDSHHYFSTDDVENWGKEFVDVDRDTLLLLLHLSFHFLFHLTIAANYLGIKNLVELTCCEGIGGWMIGKSVEEILEAFHIVNDYSPEEEEALGSEASWAFD
ncbi:hypothetical protein SUGI_0897080 [Cryptomeria japonica]|nr:hypothetical protein SUGI_0897080 [Cryptomeria japonica]